MADKPLNFQLKIFSRFEEIAKNNSHKFSTKPTTPPQKKLFIKMKIHTY